MINDKSYWKSSQVTKYWFEETAQRLKAFLAFEPEDKREVHEPNSLRICQIFCWRPDRLTFVLHKRVRALRRKAAILLKGSKETLPMEVRDFQSLRRWRSLSQIDRREKYALVLSNLPTNFIVW